jgi:hypothetical protein
MLVGKRSARAIAAAGQQQNNDKQDIAEAGYVFCRGILLSAAVFRRK